MIQCKITIEVTPDCLKGWPPEKAVEFFTLLTKLAALSEQLAGHRSNFESAQDCFLDASEALLMAQRELEDAKASYVRAKEVAEEAAKVVPPPAPEIGLKELPRPSDGPRNGVNARATKKEMDARRRKIALFLAGGPRQAAAIAEHVGLRGHEGVLQNTLNYPWFESGVDGWTLTENGRQAVGGKKLTRLRRQVAALIAAGGPQRASVLCESLCVDEIADVLDSDWFEKEEDGWHLTAKGRAEALPAKDE